MKVAVTGASGLIGSAGLGTQKPGDQVLRIGRTARQEGTSSGINGGNLDPALIEAVDAVVVPEEHRGKVDC